MLEENGPYMEMDYEVLVTYDSKNMQMTGKSSVLYNEVVTTVIDILDVEYMGLNKYRFHVSNDGETGDSYFIIDRRHPEHYTSDPLYVPVINYEKYVPYTIEELFARLGSDGGLYFDKDRRLYARFKKDTKSVELWIDGTEYYESGTCSNLNFNDAASYKMDFLSDTNKGSYEIWIHLYGEQKMIFLVMPDKDHNIYSAMTVQN